MRQLEVFHTFERILNWAGERNAISVDYGAGERLCMSEIHVIEIVGNQPGILQTQICEKMGLTKGRISVIISKLMKKDMVIRMKNASNKRELPLQLSEKGKIAFENHQSQDQLLFQKMQNIMDKYSEEEVEHFNQALHQILEALQDNVKS